MLDSIQQSFSKIKEKQPLVLCLTNYVTMDFMANSLLAIGAAPLMSESMDELEELINISQALYLNIGTLNQAFMDRALCAAAIANSLHKPVLLDPVGSGASKLRTMAASTLLPLADVIRGNASEIISLSGEDSATKGVETVHSVKFAINTAKILAQKFNKIIIISGPEDYITDGKQEQRLPFGSSIMPLITGMGCTMTAVLGAFAANTENLYQAAIHATAYFGLCGQLTHQQTNTPGTFRQIFINNLYNPDWNTLIKIANESGVKL